MRYMGSKAKIAGYLLPLMTRRRFKRPYVEPFGGGMNMICHVYPPYGPRYANDINIYLIAMWKALQDGWIPPETVSRELYEECRQLQQPDHLVGYVGFNHSYAGKFFGGFADNGTQTVGGLRDYQKEAFNNLMIQVPKLKDVTFSCGQYDEMHIPDDSIVYCDPPYADTTGYSDDFDHTAFWDWVRSISGHHRVFVSEYNAPEDFECVWQLKKKTSVSNGEKPQSKNVIEKLFKLKESD